jgi:radical SAM protein with 4Fe4S-binding SPASM domain
MDHKTFLRNKSICALPWSGFELEPNGRVKNCVTSNNNLGNINDTNIREIMHGEANKNLKEMMLTDQMPSNCSGCHLQEKDRSDLGSISSRLYYHKELANKIGMGFFDDVKNFSLKHVDLRWTNSCNQACVYCTPDLSSKWAKELGVKIKSRNDAKQEVKKFVFENIENLENVYLAGGEPMLMKENLEFLRLLKLRNPECNIRVNTNLSTTRTGIFELLCDFKNVHWIVSIETIEEEYEYVRYHGSWGEFEKNISVLQKLDHKISFNMLHFVLNYMSIFDCVDYLKGIGFHDNSFIIGPLYEPTYLNLLNLPDTTINLVKEKLNSRLNHGAIGYLKNSYENLLAYYSSTPWQKDIGAFLKHTQTMDSRRGVDSTRVFKKLFEEINVETME